MINHEEVQRAALALKTTHAVPVENFKLPVLVSVLEQGIETDEAFQQAGEALKEVARIAKAMEAERERLKRPILDQGRAIDGLFKPIQGVVATVRAHIEQAMGTYQRVRQKEHAEAMQRAALAAAAVPVTAAHVASHPAVTQALDQVRATAPPAVQGVSTRKVTRFAIEDPRQVPAEFWVIDERAVAAAVQAGRAVPGVRVWQEDAFTVRTA